MSLSTESITHALIDQPQIKSIRHFNSIGSTNEVARQLANDGTEEIALISADEQTSGRGRQGRSWFTPRGSALAISLLTRPSIPPQRAMLMTMLAGLAVVEGIEEATQIHLDLKWPNDVVAINNEQLTTPALARYRAQRGASVNNDQEIHPSSLIHHPLKVGGILTECSFQNDRIEYAVVGIGINVNVDFSQQPDLRDIATSLMELKGEAIDRLAVLESIARRFIDLYAWLNNDVKLRDAWRSRLINLGQRVRVQRYAPRALPHVSGEEILEGLAEAVDVDGALLLRTDDGQVHRLLSGDVTLNVTSDE